MLCTIAVAQDDLHIGKVFKQYAFSSGCTMVEMNNIDIKGYHLDVFKSLSYSNQGKEIADILLADRPKAKKVREIIHEGKVQNGCYMMSTSKSGKNRFIAFAFVSENSGAVIYIEGDLTVDDILKICYNQK
jgi:hypothetical protein